MAQSMINQVIPTSGTGFCKLPDGTLIMYGRGSATINANSRFETTINFSSVTSSVSFNGIPSAFANNATYTITPTGTTVVNISAADVTASKFTLLIGNTNTSSTTINYSWFAVGRWK